VLDPVGFLHRAHHRYGDAFTISVLGQRWVVLAHPNAVRDVFAHGADELDSGEPNQVLRPLIGTRNLLLLDGEEHQSRRQMVLPAFRGQRDTAHQDLIRTAATSEIATWPLGKPFAVLPRMDALAFHLILRRVFGLEEHERLGALAGALLATVKWLTDTRRQLIFFLLGPERLMSLPSFRRQLRNVDREIYAEIATRRARPDTAERRDVLSLLIQARDEHDRGLTDRELRDELITLLVAGHENTAATLAWAIHELARHPASHERLARDAGTYTDAVITETLRLRPPVPVIVRRTRTPLNIAGQQLPAGTNLCPSALLVQHRADLYPEPLSFKPERFLNQRPLTGEWFPFGGAIRRCPGAAFAQLEIKITLEEMTRALHLAPARTRLERTRPRSVVLVPAGGAQIIAHRR
jgi:cytochrome P450